MRGGNVRRMVLVVVAFGVIASACSSGATSTSVAAQITTTTIAPTTTPPTTAPPATTTTTAATTTTTTARSADIVLPDNFGDDYRYIWDEIQAFTNRMSVDPHADLVDLIIDPECDCYQFWVDLFTELEDNGWRYTGEAPPETAEFMIVSIESEDQVILRVVQEGAADAVLDSEGNIVREEAAQRNVSTIALQRSEEGRWRVIGVTGS